MKFSAPVQKYARIIQRLEAFSPQAVVFFMAMFLSVSVAMLAAEAFIYPGGIANLRWGMDFVPMWLSGSLFHEGGALHLFDPAVMVQRQSLFTQVEGVLLWHYPPTYQLLVDPLHYLPFYAALTLWTLLGAGVWVATARVYAPVKGALGFLFVFGAPASAICLMQGQNGLLTAALLGVALIARERGNAWLAGLLIALLLSKPQLGLAIPIALLAVRDWRTIGATCLFGTAFLAVSLIIYGPETWLAFFENFKLVSLAMRSGDLWSQQPGPYALLSLLGSGHMIAMTGHLFIALGAATVLWSIWRRSVPGELRIAALMTATLLITPFSFRYDMTITLLGLAMLTRHLSERHWRLGEKSLIAILWMTPAVMPTVADISMVQIGTIALAVQLWMIWRAAGEAV